MSGALFTQSEVREILSIPPETIRHWRKVLPPLAQRTKRIPYTRGDLIALALLKELIHDLGVNVSSLTAIARDLFRLCNGCSWPALMLSRAEISNGTVRVISISAGGQLNGAPVIILPIKPIIEKIAPALSRNPKAQAELALPLTPQVGRRA
jgi:hypothetical protein